MAALPRAAFDSRGDLMRLASDMAETDAMMSS
jgi:hypothetical protein